MMIAEEKTPAIKGVDQRTGQEHTVRFRQRAFKVETDDDAKALLKEFAEGVDIVCVRGEYVFTKKMEEVKVAL